jgi:hypothetical protein
MKNLIVSELKNIARESVLKHFVMRILFLIVFLGELISSIC